MNFYGLTKIDLATILEKREIDSTLSCNIFRKTYKNTPRGYQWPKAVRCLIEEMSFTLPEIVQIQSAEDGTHKFLMKVHEHHVETVAIPFFKKPTICISTQVGCAVKCSFCFTGKQGLVANLTAAEMVGQYVQAFKWLKLKNSKTPSPNLVFMGQGEPLQNFNELKRAINILTEKMGLALSPRQITVSTAGHLPGIIRFNELNGVNFALSLHTPFNVERDQLIPINKQFPINELLPAIREIKLLRKQYYVLEYLVIENFNHTEAHAQEIIRLFTNWPVVINLIPYNSTPGGIYQRPPAISVENFKALLVKGKIPTMIRTTKGSDILAACGQLNTARPHS